MREMNIKISRVFRLGQTFLNERSKKYGLSSSLFYYLIELEENDGLTLQELSQAVGVDNGHTTRMTKRLLELGYIDKRVNPQDSRSSQVFLTDRGREISKEINNIFIEWKHIVSENVSKEEILMVNQVFDKFYDNASRALGIE